MGSAGEQPKERGRSAPSGTTIFTAALASLLALMALVVLYLFLGGKPSARVPGGPVVIPPGREAAVLDLLSPLDEAGLAGLGPRSVAIEVDEIRVQLEERGGGRAGAPAEGSCGGPGWVAPPGGVELTLARRGDGVAASSSDGSLGRVERGELRLRWFLCRAAPGAPGEAASLVAAMAARRPERIWGPSPEGSPLSGGDVGLLTPLVRRLGCSPGLALVLCWLLALALTAAAVLSLGRQGRAAPVGEAPEALPARRWGALVLLCLLGLAGTGARLVVATNAPIDGDESWASPLANPVFDGDHDAWVHPPLHRALQQAYDQATGLEGGDEPPRLRLRALSVAASALALVALLAAAWLLGDPWWRGALVGLIAFAPSQLSLAVLARPYALAAALVTLTGWAIWGARPPGGGASLALRWAVAIVAAGLAGWTDLVAGLAAALLLLAGLLPGGPIAPVGLRGRALVLAAALAWLAPLAPGGWESLGAQVGGLWAAAGPDLSPARGLGGGGLPGAALGLLRFALCGDPERGWLVAASSAALLLGLGLASLRRRSWLGAALLLLVLGLVALGALVGLRARNVLFLPHLLALALVVELPPLLSSLARRPAARE